MKIKFFLTIILSLIAMMTINASKALGIIRTMTQPDGSTLSYRILGDEHFCWTQTVDGVLLVWEDSCFYVGNVTGTHEMNSSGIMAHNDGARSVEERATIAKQDEDRATFFTTPATSRAKDAGMGALAPTVSYSSSYRICPHTGTVTVPVLMVQYADTLFRVGMKKGDTNYPTEEAVKAEFEKYFNDTTSAFSLGDASVARYFRDASNGTFHLVFELHGIYNLQYSHDTYGYEGGTRDLFSDALNIAKDVDFSDARYDTNDDKCPDMVCVLFAGAGGNVTDQGKGTTKDFWPSSYPGNSDYKVNGVSIPVIGAFAELADYPKNVGDAYTRAGVGVTCHELSHGLGMPDLYDTTTAVRSNYNNNGPEFWDLMDGGENIEVTQWPCQYLAWEKDYFDWSKAVELSEPGDIMLKPLNEGGVAYKVVNPDDATEYYIFEAVQTEGWNEGLGRYFSKYASAPLGGLLVEHVSNTAKTSITPNDTYDAIKGYQPSLTLVPADGLLFAETNIDGSTVTTADFIKELEGDQYPSSKNVTSLAAYKNYKGEDMVTRYPVTDIRKNADGTISFKFMGGATALKDVVSDKTEKNEGVKKYIRNCKVIIFKDGNEYNVAGAIVK